MVPEGLGPFWQTYCAGPYHRYAVREQIGRAKYIPESERDEKFAQLFKDLDQAFADLTEEGGDNA